MPEDVLYVKSKVKEFIKGQSKYNDFRVAEETWKAINKMVGDKLLRALQRCEANKRKTLWPADF